MLKVKKTSFVKLILISVLNAFTVNTLAASVSEVEEYQKYCDDGKMFGCVLSGIAYTYSDEGAGVKQDYKKANDLYQTACDGGDMGGCGWLGSLGVLYKEGWGVKQDKSKAKHLYGLACDGGEQSGCDAYRKLNEQGVQ